MSAGFCHQRLLCFHSAKSVGAAQEIPQNRFRLIVGMVGEKDVRAAVLFRAASEKPVAKISRRGFHRFAGLFHPRGDVSSGAFMQESERGRQFRDEPCVLGRCPSAQGVIEVANDEIPEPRLEEQMQQRHGIRTA